MTKNEQEHIMRIKNIIARRRPSALDEPEAAPDPREALAPPPEVAEPQAYDPDLAHAREAVGYVPRPQRPQIKDQPDWSLPADELEFDRTPTRPVDPEPAPHPTGHPTAHAAQTRPAKLWNTQPQATAALAPAPEPGAHPMAPPPMQASPMQASQMHAPASEPAPQPARRIASERVKTRLIGFHGETGEDVFAGEPKKTGAEIPHYPVGWLVVIDGPGRGASYTLTAGLTTIGRDADQTVSLDFGDTSISRERHASVAYDEEDNRVYVGHGGKSNIVRLNGKPLLSTEELGDGDKLKIGKTTLRYVAFCTPDFSWIEDEDPADG